MKNMCILRNAGVILTILVLTRASNAHFPWLTVDQDGKAAYFFGESPAERAYKLPESLTNSAVHSVTDDGKRVSVSMVSIESDEFVGRKSRDQVSRNSRLISRVTYGVYQGSRLEYYSQHAGGALSKDRKGNKQAKPRQELSAEVIDTETGVDVFITWKGKPLTGVDVRLFCEDGHEEGHSRTDDDGKVSFTDNEVESGLNGIMVGHTVKGDSGVLGEDNYESTSHYLTATFNDPQDYATASQP